MKQEIVNLYGKKSQINSRPLHRDLAGQKGLAEYIQGPNEKNMQLGIPYPARLSFRIEGEIKSFQDRQKRKEYVTTKPAL